MTNLWSEEEVFTYYQGMLDISLMVLDIEPYKFLTVLEVDRKTCIKDIIVKGVLMKFRC